MSARNTYPRRRCRACRRTRRMSAPICRACITRHTTPHDDRRAS